MEKKINIAELLKDCPIGTKLYSPLCGECRVSYIYDGLGFDVICGDDTVYNFSYDGRYNIMGECCIFPSKECRDWSKFQKPFKNGDIVFYNDTIAIFKEWGDETLFRTYVIKYLYNNHAIVRDAPLFGKSVRKEVRLATEEEKEKLFQAIKDNGYRWNAEAKTLEKLTIPHTSEKFYIRIGDIPSNEKSKIHNGDSVIGEEDGVSVYNCIKLNNTYHIVMPLPLKEGQGITYENLIQEITQCRYEIEKPRNVYLVSGMEIGKGHDNEPLIKNVKILKDLTGQFNTKNYSTEETKTLEKLPKFKVGDKIKYKNGKNIDGVEQGVILSITDDTYDVAVTNDMGIFIPISDQDNWELVPNKFDITTLKPLKSEVLVRDSIDGMWEPSFWGKYIEDSNYRYLTTNGSWKQCIPYKGNQYLLGTTGDCDKFYKTWE